MHDYSKMSAVEAFSHAMKRMRSKSKFDGFVIILEVMYGFARASGCPEGEPGSFLVPDGRRVFFPALGVLPKSPTDMQGIHVDPPVKF